MKVILTGIFNDLSNFSNCISGDSIGSNEIIIPPIEKEFNYLSKHGGLKANKASIIGVYSITAKYMKESINKVISSKYVMIFLLMISSENFATPLYLSLSMFLRCHIGNPQ